MPHEPDIPVRPVPHGPDIPVRPVPHGPDIPVPTSPLPQTEIFSRSYAKDDEVHSSSGTEIKISQLLNQSELNNLVRDLDFTKEKRELLGTRLKKTLLDPGTNFYCCGNHEEAFKKFFIKEGKLVYCCGDMLGLIHRL